MLGAHVSVMKLLAHLALLSSLTALALVACGGSDSEAQNVNSAEPQQNARRYTGQGDVREIRDDRSSVTIQHDEIEGYMPAMTMPFLVEDASLLEGISVGARVEFTFSVEASGHHVVRALRAL